MMNRYTLARTAMMILTAISPALATAATIGDKGIAALRDCQLPREDEARLACFDRAAAHYLSFDFHGNGREHTPSFESAEGFRLEFHSDSVIFVVYVFNADNEELVNTYSSGPGEGEISVHEGGRFFIEVKATDSWKIRVRQLAISD